MQLKKYEVTTYSKRTNGMRTETKIAMDKAKATNKAIMTHIWADKDDEGLEFVIVLDRGRYYKVISCIPLGFI